MILWLSSHDPIVVSESIVPRRVRTAPCIEIFSDKGGQRASFIKYNGNGGVTVWMKKFPLEGE
jgi:hypothetical protein